MSRPAASSRNNRSSDLFWNPVSKTWSATPGNAKQGKPALKTPVLRHKLIVTALALVFAPMVCATPLGGEVTSGSGSIDQSGATTTITQTSQNLSLNWNSFNIGSSETVDFLQPSASSIAVNRILDTNGTQILGNLNANGQVYLINPNGILFGQGAQVNVGGLVASTINIDDVSLTGDTRTFSGSGTGSIVNQGTLTAANGGYIALLGNTVSNQGSINAHLGSVALGAGSAATLTFAGNSLVKMQIDQSILNALAENKAIIQADGGLVLMSAGAKDSLLASVVNNTGIIEARTVENRNGTIILLGGMTAGTVNAGGTLDASGLNTGETGGSVKVLGNQVALLDGANINTSGDAGGGTVLVGGNYQGNGPEQNATATFVGQGAQISADAVNNGNGGRIIVWSDEATRVYGSLSAKGGTLSGNGGFIETSGKKYLEVTQGADASANNGASGTWLLDPNDITIQATGVDTNVTASPNFTSNNDSAIVTTTSINTALNAGTSVVITTASAGTNTQPGNITVNGAINGGRNNTATTLTLNAQNNIDVNAAITGAGNAGANLSLVFNASGAVNLSAAAIISGRIGNVTFNSATASQLAGSTIGSTSNLAGKTVTVNTTGNATMAGLIQNAFGVTQQGPGTLTLSGTNTYTGVTRINAGVLSVATIGNGGTAGNLGQAAAGAANLVLGGGTLQYTGATASTNRAYTLTAATTSSIDISTSTTNLTMSGSSANTTGALTKTGAGTLTFSAAKAYTGLTTVNAGTLAYGANNVLSTGAVTVNGGTLSMLTFSDTVGTVTLANGSITGTTGTLTSTGSFELQNGAVSKILAGAVPLNKTTTGTVTLSGVNTYTGVTSINAGVLSVGTIGNGGVAGNLGAAAVAATNLVLGGGTLQYTGATAATNRAFTLTAGTTSSIDVSVGANTLTMSGTSAVTNGALTKIGAGTLTLSGANGYTGLTTVSAGILTEGAANALSTGALTVNGGTFNLGAFSDSVGTVTLTNGSITGTTGVLTSTGSFEMQNGSVSAILGGAVALNKATAGTVMLSGANTYTGVTTINAGTISVATIGNGGVAGNLGAATNVASNLVLDGGTLQYTGVTASTDRAYTLTGGTTSSIDVTNVATNLTVTGAGANTTGALTKTGAGTLTLSGANLYTGLTTVSAGTLAEGVANALSTGALTVNGGTFNLGAFSDSVGTVTLTNGSITGSTGVLTSTGSFEMQNGSVSAILGGAVALNKTTAGTVTLTGANTYTGATTVSAGTLAYGTNDALSTGTVTVDGGTLALGTFSDSVGTVTLTNGSITGSTGVLTSTGSFEMQNGSVSAILGGAVALNKTTAGTVTLSGANRYTGATIVGAGILKLGAGGDATNTPLGTTATGTVVSSGAVLDMNGYTLGTAEALTLNGTGISSGGALTNSSAMAATYNGPITLGSNSSISVTSGKTLGVAGSINGAFALDMLGGGAITLGGDIGNSTPLASLNGAAGTVLNINSSLVSTSGAQSYSGATTFGAATTLTAGSINASGAVTATAGMLTLSTGAGNAIFSNIANDFGTVAASSGNDVSIHDINSVSIDTINVTGQVNVRADAAAACVAGAASCGTVSFTGTGHISAATTNLYYNPTGSNNAAGANGAGPTYAAPTNYAANVTGTLNAYMLVNDVNQLQAIKTNLSGTYALGANIDASSASTWNAGAGFTPVGATLAAAFTGIFDGSGHTISNLVINRSGSNYIGLFGATGSGSVVRNVGIAGGSVIGLNYVGGLVGWNYGSIINSYASCSVSGGASGRVGGLVGQNNSPNLSTAIISSSYATGNVTAGTGGYAGGLVGYVNTSSQVNNSYATGNVSGGNTSIIGGLVGQNAGIINNGYSTGLVSNVVGTTPSRMGGLIGLSFGSPVNNSFWDITTSGQATSSGGTGMTTADMMTLANFTTATTANGNINPNWDLANTWFMVDGATRPFLRSEYSTTVNNAHQLQLMAMDLGASYTLGANIDLAELSNASGMWNTTAGFVPIGDSTTPFTGQLDGSSYSISNLYINLPATNYVGLFGYTSAAALSNVNVTGNVTGFDYVGGIVGKTNNLSTVSASSFTGSVTGNAFVGGIVGWNDPSMIENVFVDGIISGVSNVGGIAGWNDGSTINIASFSGSVSGTDKVGGLTGENSGVSNISNVIVAGNVNGTTNEGGIAGVNTSTGSVSASYWDAEASGQVNATGSGASTGTTGVTTAEMTHQASFPDLDFVDTWRIYEGHSTPLLSSFLTPLTITIIDASKTYDGIAYSGSNGYTTSLTPDANLLGSITYGGSSQGAVNAGSYSIAGGGLYSTQSGYDITFVNGTLTVDPRAVDLSGSRFYDATTVVSSDIFTLGNLVSGETLTLNGTGSVGSKDVSAGTQTVTLETLTLGDGTGLAGNYTFNGGTHTADITPAALTLSTGDISKIYDGNLSASGTATVTSGILYGTDSLSGGTYAFTDMNVGSGNKTVTTTGISVNDGNNGGNYNVTYADNTTSTITQLASVAWSGGAIGNWSNASNWAGGAIPVGNNVAAVTIPTGVTVTYDNGVVGTTTLNTLTSSGDLTMAAGNLTTTGDLSTAGYTQTGGILTVDGTLVINSDTSVTLGNIIAQRLDITSTGGSIAQTAGNSLTVTGDSILMADNGLTGASNIKYGINLSNIGNNFIGTVNTNGRVVNLMDSAGGLILGNTIATYSFTATSQAGAITQAAGNTLTVNGASTLTADNGLTGVDNVQYDISLANAGNNFIGAVNTKGLNVSLLDSVGRLTLGTTFATGTLNATAQAGAIKQAAGKSLSVTGASTLIADNGIEGAGNMRYDITLANAGNDFIGAVNTTGKTITLSDVNALNATVNSTAGSILASVDTLNVAGTVGTRLTTTTTGVLADTIFGATSVGNRLLVDSTGTVQRATDTTVLTVNGATATTFNPRVTVNGVVGAVIP